MLEADRWCYYLFQMLASIRSHIDHLNQSNSSPQSSIDSDQFIAQVKDIFLERADDSILPGFQENAVITEDCSDVE